MCYITEDINLKYLNVALNMTDLVNGSLDRRLWNYRHIKVKVKLSMYRPWRPLGLREVKAPTVSDIRLVDGGKVVRPKRRPFFTPRKILDTHFC
jgi:hypothetical protein